MALEAPVTFIHTLNASNPVSGDPAQFGDDHIRNIKGAILTTFPNITSAVTATAAELNFVDGVTAPIQAQFDAIILEAISELSGKQDTAPELTDIDNLVTFGLLVKSDANNVISRKIVGAGETVVTNDDGVAGDITITTTTNFNPLANADVGMPRIKGRALDTYLGYRNFTATSYVFANLDRYGEILVQGHFKGSDAADKMNIEFSNNNGSSYGAVQMLIPISTNTGVYITAINLQTGLVSYSRNTATGLIADSLTLTVPSNCNAFRISRSTAAANSFTAFVTSLGGLI